MKALISLTAALLLCWPAGAAQLEDLKPKVSFSAWRVMSAGGEQMEGRYHYAPGKHRSEMEIGGEKMTTIVREDLEVIWNLMPGQGMYLEMSSAEFTRQSGPLGPESTQLVEHERLGAEVLDGYHTTKHRITTRDEIGGVATGHFWATREMIPVRMEMTTEDGERVIMRHTDIQIGEQSDALFEVPVGYRKFSLGGLSGLDQAWQTQGSDEADGPGLADEMLDTASDAAKQGAKQGVQQKVRQGVRKLFGN